MVATVIAKNLGNQEALVADEAMAMKKTPGSGLL
jgi:hypothetical protein